MRAFSKWAAWGALMGAVALSACGGVSVDAETAAAAQAGGSEDPPEVAHMRFIREALSKVTVRADQKAIVEQLGREADARHEPIRNARAALQAALADQVAAGKIDRAALKPQVDALLQAIEQSRAADRLALGRLHDVLDKTQRSQFVDAIEDQFHRGRPEHGGMRAKRWAADLNLTDQQRDQIRASIQAKFQGDRDAMREQFHKMREQGKAMLESFREDQFTPDANAPIFGKDKLERGVGKMIDLAEAAIPVLTPEQRAIAAQKIRTGFGRF